jgi:hypothetical protein
MRTKLFLTGIAALLLATGAAHAATPGEGLVCSREEMRADFEACTKKLNEAYARDQRVPLPHRRPLTPKQARSYKELRSIGLTKKDAARVARDPGVKKNQWGWGCTDEGRTLERVKGGGAKYKTNAVCE